MAIWESVVALVLTLHLSRIVGWGSFSIGILRQALSYALPLLPAGLSIWMLDRGDRLVIGSYLGPKAVGIYSANYAVASLLMLFQAPLQMTLLPKVSALWQQNRESALRYISVSNKVFLTFAIPFVVGLPFVSGRLLSRFGSEEIGGAGGMLTFLITAGVLLWGVSIMQCQIFYGAKRTVAVAVVTVSAAVLNLGLNLLLVPVWGIQGSALSTLACYLLSCLGLFFLSREVRLRFYWTHLLKSLAAALLMAVVLRLVDVWSGQLLPAIAAGAVTYFLAMWLLRAISRIEIQLIRNFFRVPAAVRE
jgi:O-antigen/teichoic acid export membrane protein